MSARLQWGRNILVAERMMPPMVLKPLCQLQWGRNILVAESLVSVPTTLFPHIASMGPQHTRCGKAHAETAPRAAARLQWGRNILVAERWAQSAIPCRTSWLQWGRNILVAERWASLLVSGEKTAASMGPQHTRCGKHEKSKKLRHVFRMLQWGRNILVAESPHTRLDSAPAGRLRHSVSSCVRYAAHVLLHRTSATPGIYSVCEGLPMRASAPGLSQHITPRLTHPSSGFQGTCRQWLSAPRSFRQSRR